MSEQFRLNVRYRRRATNTSVGILVVVLSLTACGNATNPLNNEGQLMSIGVSGTTVVQAGDTVQLSARGKVRGLLGPFTYDRVLDAVWAVSDPKIASIVPVKPIAGDTTSGSAIILTELQQGSVQVTATARGVQGSATVRVLSTP